MREQFLTAEAVFFDFDGVIADSHGVKTRAFAALYADEHPEVVDEVVRYHNANGGLSRYRKFEYYERTLLGQEPTPERIAQLGDRFATAVVDAVVASPEIPGACAFLEALRAMGKRCYVASGTPEEELIEIVERRALTPYFHSVRGSPTEKPDILRELSALHGHDIGNCIMVGDAMSDFHAAQTVGMPFVGVVQHGARAPFPSGTPVVPDFWMLAEAGR